MGIFFNAIDKKPTDTRHKAENKKRKYDLLPIIF